MQAENEVEVEEIHAENENAKEDSDEEELVPTRFSFGRKSKVRKLGLVVDFENIRKLVHKLFPELADKKWELTYGEYSIDSADDWEGSIEEFRSLQSGFWFPLTLIDPNAPAIVYKPRPSVAPAPVARSPVARAPVATQNYSSAPPPAPAANHSAPLQRTAPSPSRPKPSGASYPPHKHLGQMTPDQRILHKLVWAHQQVMRPITVFDLRDVLPKGKKKPSKNKLTQLMQMGIAPGYFQLHQGNSWTLGTCAIPFDSFVPQH